MQREIPLFTLEGVDNAEKTIVPVSTGDGLGITLTRFLRAPGDDVVVIFHGLTTSSDMFIMPEHKNLVQYLLDNGIGDVWCVDFRMSNHFPYNLTRHRYSMDDVALFDHPAAIAKVRESVGNARIHVICHCLGAVSFMMSLFAKQVEGITSVIANSVALTPRIKTWSRIKLSTAPFLVEYILQQAYLSPSWPREPGLSIGRIISWFVSLAHRESKVRECHMLSMMWGSGNPALYKLKNLHEITHKRGGDLYGPTSMNYYRHVAKMVAKGNRAVKYRPGDSRLSALPDDYLADAADIETPCLLITGEDNDIFTDSNVVCHEVLEKAAPGRHQLHVFPGYGHQDVFMGKNCDQDIFPRLLEFINEHKVESKDSVHAGKSATAVID
jgi:cholesterol oxidase